MGSSREERLALNEAMFRAANERMAGWEERHGTNEHELYVCECSDPSCREQVKLSRDEYESVRKTSDQFFVVTGHEVPEVETVIESHDGWAVLVKNPDVADLVAKTDPRRG